MTRFRQGLFRSVVLRPVMGLMILAQANVLAQELPAAPATDLRQAVRERPLEQAVRSALPDIAPEATKSEAEWQQKETALSGDSYRAFSREFAEAKVPYCLHHDGLKRQPTGIGPFVIGGYLALPFIFVARARAKCLF
ncbi:hypothetical protein [Massilia sp. YIM B02443]|uniref:hypothetical protein n=1 Tax=Massilia sp. YIM B02443 TaxID=3050127 RepID=UPI0025B63283|nr:hypothetical protein [Massilia sp. YIM B02443]MDN4036313.1 hypothetical protein [Massilia sp. YIM B02443]